jgi:methylenetetrahydrofolate dehydrogenase (NADP+) / methenyltetrahydrofolate cyclohydrolase / formyltetrahydrofolate synthetase
LNSRIFYLTKRGFLQKCKSQIIDCKIKLPHFQPSLAIVQVGKREDSNIYIKNKIRTAHEIGILAKVHQFNANINEFELKEKILNLNSDSSVHAIIIQLPFDSIHTLNSEKIINCLNPFKDVDGLTFENAGKLTIGKTIDNTFIPCTPKGCLELIKSTGVEISGKNAVVIGRSLLVGTPMANLLLHHDATVTTCHSKTKNLQDMCKTADILVVAIGCQEYIKGEWIKPGAVVIDCGINSREERGKIYGDVDFESARKQAGFITPVPGGVGPMTVAMLMENTLEAAKRFYFK